MITVFELPPEYGLLTLNMADALKHAEAVVLQSGRNGAAVEIIAKYPHTATLDEVYENAEDFDSLYEGGAAEILRLAGSGRTVFGVIGDIATNGFIEKLRGKAEMNFLAGVSAEEIAKRGAEERLGALGGYAVVEARELEGAHIDTSAALIVRGVDNALTAADVKLALLERYAEDTPAVFVCGGEAAAARLAELDSLENYGDGACVVLSAPGLSQKSAYGFYDLVDIMKVLRGKNGCPWDREQTHKTLRQYLLEESYEAMDAIDADDMAALYDELGDVLLQVVFHAEIARQCGEFTHMDVTSAVCAKMINRHPHIFADGDAETADAVVTKWEEIKRAEKGNETFVSVLRDVPRSMGAMMRAYKLQKKAGAIGFDWETAQDAFGKVLEELQELKAEVDAMDVEKIEDEAGDLLFAIINVLRKVRINPEVALTGTCEKFIHRFEYMEAQAGEKLPSLTLKEMDELWNRAKQD